MFCQNNLSVMFGCTYHTLSFTFILYAPVHFVHYTFITGTDKERSGDIWIDMFSNTKKYYFIFNLFYLEYIHYRLYFSLYFSFLVLNTCTV